MFQTLLVSHHNHVSDAESADDSEDSSAEGGDNDDDDGVNDDDDNDDDDDSSDENLTLSNFNLLSSSMYVALMNMNFKKISANELCLIL